jgi:hypothetical protein
MAQRCVFRHNQQQAAWINYPELLRRKHDAGTMPVIMRQERLQLCGSGSRWRIQLHLFEQFEQSIGNRVFELFHAMPKLVGDLRR